MENKDKKIIKNITIGVVIFSIIGFALTVILISLSEEVPKNLIFFLLLNLPFSIFFWIAIIYLLYKFFLEKKEIESPSMRSFAKRNNLFFFLKNNEKDKKSSAKLLNGGESRRIYNYMKGIYAGKEVEIYNYSHSWKNISYEYLVVEVKIKNKLPNFMIASPNSYLIDANLNLPLEFTLSKDFQFISEANEFNKEFKIILSRARNKEDDLKILEILTPDIMMSLIDENKREPGKNINMEVTGGRILLYKRVLIRNQGVLGNNIKGDIVQNEQNIKRLVDMAIEISENINN